LGDKGRVEADDRAFVSVDPTPDRDNPAVVGSWGRFIIDEGRVITDKGRVVRLGRTIVGHDPGFITDKRTVVALDRTSVTQDLAFTTDDDAFQ